MELDLSLTHVLGLATGGLILALGLFVLLARPSSPLHRLFFALAVADAASNVLFELRNMTTSPEWRMYFMSTYWYFFLAFVTLLVSFGLVFPRPIGQTESEGSGRFWALLSGAVALAGIAALAAYAVNHDWFWVAQASGSTVTFGYPTLGRIILGSFVAATALVILRLAFEMGRGTSLSRRRQAAFVLGGIAIAYAPYATTSFVQTVVATTDYGALFADTSRGGLFLTHGGMFVALVAVAFAVARVRDRDLSIERVFVMVCLSAVAALTLVSLLEPTRTAIDLLQILGLLAYPLLLGYAIVRYEVFDIDAKMRRAATVTITGAGIAAVFIVAENALQGLLEDELFGGIPSGFAAGMAAAVTAALVGLPVVKIARRLARRIVPELTDREVHTRKLEIYRHGLEGALADGLVSVSESRTLSALRETLGVTPEEHEALVAAIAREKGRARSRGIPTQ